VVTSISRGNYRNNIIRNSNRDNSDGSENSNRGHRCNECLSSLKCIYTGMPLMHVETMWVSIWLAQFQSCY
jgi:hypothetical protein